MNTEVVTRYRKHRATGVGARTALQWARALVYDHVHDGQTFQVEGFDVVVRFEVDVDDTPEWYGTFTDTWSPEVVERHNPGRFEYRYFLPTYPEAQYRADLAKRMGRHAAWVEARRKARHDLDMAESFGRDWTTWLMRVGVSRNGILLGSAAIGSVDLGKDECPDTSDFVAEMFHGDLIPEAIAEARDALAKLCEYK